MRALRTAAVAFFCFKASAAFVGFLATFDLAANLAPAFVVPVFLGTGFLTLSLAPAVLAFGFGLAPVAGLAVFLAASVAFLVTGFLAAAAFLSAGLAAFLAAVAFWASPAGRFGAAAAGFLSAGFFSAGFFSAAGFFAAAGLVSFFVAVEVEAAEAAFFSPDNK